MRVSFLTFGCRLNRAEALDLEARYLAAGHTIIPLPRGTVPKNLPSLAGSVPIHEGSVPPDRIIVRGCSVTAKAQRDCEKAIVHLRDQFPSSQIILTGCLPGSIAEAGTVPNANTGSVPNSPDSAIPVNQSTSRAYLKIQDGCSGKCAFCIVPKFRGPPRSVPFAEIMAQARAYLATGFRELVITGCNLALYRDSGHRLPDLLAALAHLPSNGDSPPTIHGDSPSTIDESKNRKIEKSPTHRIRLGSLEPGICDEKLLDTMAENANICRFIHLSVQSGSNRILKAMNRPYSVERVRDFCIEAGRRLGPRLALGADLITGFPGETEEDFALTRDLVLGTDLPFKFVNLHVFPYSERPGTPAATMTGSVPRTVRIARARELETIGRKNRRRFAAAFVGQTVQACVEKDGNGWTDEYLRARLPPGLPRRQLVDVCVSAEDGDTLITELQSSLPDRG